MSPCEWLQGPNGETVHINYGRGGKKPKPCSFCHKRPTSKLCDYPVGDGKTCDAGMCDQCATRQGYQDTPVGTSGLKRMNDTVDLCPDHKHQVLP